MTAIKLYRVTGITVDGREVYAQGALDPMVWDDPTIVTFQEMGVMDKFREFGGVGAIVLSAEWSDVPLPGASE